MKLRPQGIDCSEAPGAYLSPQAKLQSSIPYTLEYGTRAAKCPRLHILLLDQTADLSLFWLKANDLRHSESVKYLGFVPSPDSLGTAYLSYIQ